MYLQLHLIVSDRAVQFADIGRVKVFDAELMLKVVEYITVFEDGRLVVRFMEGTEVESGG